MMTMVLALDWVDAADSEHSRLSIVTAMGWRRR